MSSSEDEGSANAGDYDEWSDDGKDGRAQSLFSPELLPDSAAAIAHDACSHGFDLAKFRLQVRHAPPSVAALLSDMGVAEHTCRICTAWHCQGHIRLNVRPDPSPSPEVSGFAVSHAESGAAEALGRVWGH